MSINVLEVVKLEVDLPDEGLAKGDIGAVVYEFSVPYIAYEVEFVDSEGRTIAQLPLLPSQLSKVE